MKPIEFSQLNKIIVLEKPIRVQDGLGGYTKIWQESSRTWAKITQCRSNDVAKNFYKIIIRFRKNLSLDMRVRYCSNYYKIDAIHNIDGKAAYIEIVASERVRNDLPY